MTKKTSGDWMPKELEFSFEGSPVGVFEELERPQSPGRYRFMPYRSIGHMKLGEALREKQYARCTLTAFPKVSFAVVDYPEYGILELVDFLTEQ